MLLVGCVVCGAAVASEESAPGQEATSGASGGQGMVVAPGEARGTAAGGASANESAVGGVGGVVVGMPAGQTVAPGAAASVAVPGASAAEVSGSVSREAAIGQGVRAESAPGSVRVEAAPSEARESVTATAVKGAESVGAAANEVTSALPEKVEASQRLGEERVVNRAERALGVHGLRVESVQGEALVETSNVGVEEQVARMSPDRAWNVNQAEALAVRERMEEARSSHQVASQAVRNSAEAIRARREVLAMSAPSGTEESVVQGEAREGAASMKTAEAVSSASARVVVTSGVTLVHVTAQNTAEEVVERPVVELALPKGMRYEALASAPPNTAVRVERTQAGETVEMVLPFALFQREAVEIAVETSPAPEVGVSGVKVRVRPLEEGLRVVPQGAAGQVVPMGSEGTSVKEHLHPRP